MRFCAIFIDLFKVFVTVKHDLLITELGTYGSEKYALRTENKI